MNAIIGAFKAVGAAWQILMWLRKEKKQMEADVDGYFTADRATAWRLTAEKVFHALETGNGNLKSMPKVVQWLFSKTTADNRIGLFGLYLLKSEKLRAGNKVLDEPIKPYRCH